MKTSSIIRLLTLAAIWGGSFIFLRILAPVLGPILTTNLRVLIAGIVLSIYFLAIKLDSSWKKNWKHYLIVGTVNTAIPFTLFAYGALYLPASYEVILNSTAPLFGVVFSWIWLREKMNLQRLIGIVAAGVGVGFVVNVGSAHYDANFFKAVAACLLAASCYALAGIYIKKFASHVKPMSFASCCQLVAGMALIPLTFTQPISIEINTFIVLNVLGLSLLCSGVAYILYYQLLADEGPGKALTVTFLMPVFGMLWGAVFLGETITAQMILGTAFILGGTWFVVKKA